MTSTTSTPSDRNTQARDRRGLPLSTSLEAAAHYREAIEAVLASGPRVAELLDQAIACDPGFALARAARWMQAHADGDRSRARAERESALSALDDVTEWERSHVECLASLIEHDDSAWTRCRNHLAAHPRDLVVASQLIGDLFFHGGVGKRQAVVDLLRSLIDHNSTDWAFLARLGFHTSELGDHHNAIAILARALKMRPDAPFVAHAMAHAILESGRRTEAHRFLLDWASRYDAAGPIDGHIQWHLSLGEMESGEVEASVDRYLRWSAPGTSHCAAGLLLADAGGLFFRMALRGQTSGRIPRRELHELLDGMRRALKIPFVAVHAAALAIALGDDEGQLYLEEIHRHLGKDAETAVNVIEALVAYQRGDMAVCVEALERDRLTQWEALGGSNEERALLARLYDAARAQLDRQLGRASTASQAAGLLRVTMALLLPLLSVCTPAQVDRPTAPREQVRSALARFEPCIDVPVEQLACDLPGDLPSDSEASH